MTVCPTGIDIRNGIQLECVVCAACVDACNGVMARLGRPGGLIRFTSHHAIATIGAGRTSLSAAHADQSFASRMAQTLKTGLSARVVAYTGVWLMLAVSVAVLLAGRRDLDVLILRQPGTLYTTITGGDIANFYTVQALNRTNRTRAFTIEVVRPAGATIFEPGRARRCLALRPGGKPRHAAAPGRATSREPTRRFSSPCAPTTASCRPSTRRSSVRPNGSESTAGPVTQATHTMSVKLNWGTGIALVYAAFAAATTGFGDVRHETPRRSRQRRLLRAGAAPGRADAGRAEHEGSATRTKRCALRSTRNRPVPPG